MTTVHFHPVRMLRMCGVALPSEDNFTFTFTFCICVELYISALLVSLVLILVFAHAEVLCRSSVHAFFVTAVCCVSAGLIFAPVIRFPS